MARGLGRGFESLIPTEVVEEEFDLTAEEDARDSQLVEIDLEEIVRDEEQPRKKFSKESLEMLALSIKEHGVLQPIVVVKEEDKYKIVAGERRWRAAKIADLKKIPAIIRTLDAQNRLELSIIENAQREDLNPIELATAYAKLKAQFNLSDEQIGARVGKAKATVTNIMRLLRLPEEVKRAIVEYNIREGVVRPLVTLEPELVKEIMPKIIEGDWTARQVERYVAEHKKKSSAVVVKDSTYTRQENKLSKKYGVKVRVHGRSVTFSCPNEEELRKLLTSF